MLDEVEEDDEARAQPRWPRGSRGGGARSSSQLTPSAEAAEPMDKEGEEDDFMKERPRRTNASQVWRFRALITHYIDISGCVWLSSGDIRFRLEIFSPIWRFSVLFDLEIFGSIWRLCVVFLEIFRLLFWRFTVLISKIFCRRRAGSQESGLPP